MICGRLGGKIHERKPASVLVSVPVEDYFRLVANEVQLAATIRVQATFAMFHHGEIKIADEHAAQLQDRLNAYLDSLN